MTMIKVKVETKKRGFSDYAAKYSAFTTGKTVMELVTNMVESLNLYFEEAGIKKVVSPGDVRFEVDVTSIFEIFPVINVTALAGRLGMNYTLISHYATGRKKPSSRQAERILEGIHEIGRELSELRLIV